MALDMGYTLARVTSTIDPYNKAITENNKVMAGRGGFIDNQQRAAKATSDFGRAVERLSGMAAFAHMRQYAQYLNEFASGLLNAAAAMETFQVQYAGLLGSTTSKNITSQLRTMAVRTPFEYMQIMGAGQQFAGVWQGMYRQNPSVITDPKYGLTSAIRASGEASAGTGYGLEEVMRTITRSRIPGGGWRRLSFGRDILGPALDEAGASTRGGEETYKAAIDVLMNRFGGMMDKQMGTLNQQISNLRDVIADVSVGSGSAMLPSAKGVTAGLRGVIGMGTKPVIKEMLALTGIMAGVTAATGSLVAAMGLLQMSIAQVQDVAHEGSMVRGMLHRTGNIAGGFGGYIVGSTAGMYVGEAIGRARGLDAGDMDAARARGAAYGGVALGAIGYAIGPMLTAGAKNIYAGRPRLGSAYMRGIESVAAPAFRGRYSHAWGTLEGQRIQAGQLADAAQRQQVYNRAYMAEYRGFQSRYGVRNITSFGGFQMLHEGELMPVSEEFAAGPEYTGYRRRVKHVADIRASRIAAQKASLAFTTGFDPGAATLKDVEQEIVRRQRAGGWRSALRSVGEDAKMGWAGAKSAVGEFTGSGIGQMMIATVAVSSALWALESAAKSAAKAQDDLASRRPELVSGVGRGLADVKLNAKEKLMLSFGREREAYRSAARRQGITSIEGFDEYFTESNKNQDRGFWGNSWSTVVTGVPFYAITKYRQGQAVRSQLEAEGKNITDSRSRTAERRRLAQQYGYVSEEDMLIDNLLQSTGSPIGSGGSRFTFKGTVNPFAVIANRATSWFGKNFAVASSNFSAEMYGISEVQAVQNAYRARLTAQGKVGSAWGSMAELAQQSGRLGDVAKADNQVEAMIKLMQELGDEGATQKVKDFSEALKDAEQATRAEADARRQLAAAQLNIASINASTTKQVFGKYAWSDQAGYNQRVSGDIGAQLSAAKIRRDMETPGSQAYAEANARVIALEDELRNAPIEAAGRGYAQTQAALALAAARPGGKQGKAFDAMFAAGRGYVNQLYGIGRVEEAMAAETGLWGAWRQEEARRFGEYETGMGLAIEARRPEPGTGRGAALEHELFASNIGMRSARAGMRRAKMLGDNQMLLRYTKQYNEAKASAFGLGLERKMRPLDAATEGASARIQAGQALGLGLGYRVSQEQRILDIMRQRAHILKTMTTDEDAIRRINNDIVVQEARIVQLKRERADLSVQVTAGMTDVMRGGMEISNPAMAARIEKYGAKAMPTWMRLQYQRELQRYQAQANYYSKFGLAGAQNWQSAMMGIQQTQRELLGTEYFDRYSGRRGGKSGGQGGGSLLGQFFNTSFEAAAGFPTALARHGIITGVTKTQHEVRLMVQFDQSDLMRVFNLNHIAELVLMTVANRLEGQQR